MEIDLDDIRRHCNSLGDEALLAINRSDLTEAAQKIYDEELRRRNLVMHADDPAPAPRFRPRKRDPQPPEEEPLVIDPGDAPPHWLEDSSCACSFDTLPGLQVMPNLGLAREALRAASIPNYVVFEQVDPNAIPPPTHYEYRVMVPSAFILAAQSVLDKQIFNRDFEAEWRAHFGAMSDEELLELDSEAVFGGLRDRIERVERAYHEEIAERRRVRAAVEGE